MFEERVTAFVDILGFSDLVARMPAEPSLFETVKGTLEAVLSAGETLYAGAERLGVLTDRKRRRPLTVQQRHCE